MRLFFTIVLTFVCVASVRAGSPTTAPSTQPAAQFSPDAPARSWFADLASPDINKREQARTNLMGLSRDDLPSLQNLVRQNQPLPAAVAGALHEIVIQIYLSGEDYTAEFPVIGFLGVSWIPAAEAPLVQQQIFNMEQPRLGVPVLVRFPGFPSFRMLQDGDLILGVLLDPSLPVDQAPNQPTPVPTDLHRVVGAAGANHTILLDILRQGQEIQVPLKLQPHPLMELGQEKEFFVPRQQKAEDYWHSEFLPLIRPHMS